MDDQTQEPIGSINGAYLGALFLLIAMVIGCWVGGLLVYAFAH